MSWPNIIPEKTLKWLLEPEDPGARHLALKQLSDLSENDPKIISAREIAHLEVPIKTVLDAMHLDGYWVDDGPVYNPKYRSAVWSLILLAQLGASAEFDSRINKACQRYLNSVLSANGQISSTGPPSGTSDCLQGNILASLYDHDLGYLDPRLDKAFEWMARSVTGEGVSPMKEKNAALRYYAGKITNWPAPGVL